ncbi:MAG: helix-turn-helix domain-containing protein [bacterium]
MAVQTLQFPTHDPDQHLNEQEAAALLGYTRRALQNWRRTGTGPCFVRISSRSVRYRRKDLLKWSERRLCQSTSDPGPAAGVAQ